LVGTTADFRGFGPRPSLPINHLLGKNRGTAGRIGEVGLEIERYRNRVLREAAFAEPGITKASGWPLGGGPPPVPANAVSEPPPAPQSKAEYVSSSQPAD
jgi:hypothetical protein